MALVYHVLKLGWVCFYLVKSPEKKPSVLLLNSSLCSINVAWPEFGTIHKTACGTFSAISFVC